MIYLCGPMSGLPDLNYPAFNQWAETLRPYGYEVASMSENPECPSWEHYMRLSMVQLAQCEGVALLDGWQGSRGARLEVFVAGELGIEVKLAGEWAS